MAWERQSPGIYKNTDTGEVRRSATRPGSSSGGSSSSAASGGGDLSQLMSEIQSGLSLASGSLGMGEGFLGRVDDSAPVSASDPSIMDSGDLLARLKAESEKGGQQTLAQRDSLNMLKDLARNSGQMSPEMRGIIDERRGEFADAGAMSPEMQILQDLYRSEYDNSRNLDPTVQETLDLRRNALDGLSSPEMTAIQESLMRNADQAFGGALRSGAAASAAAGRGNEVSPAMLRALSNDFMGQQLQANQDTLLADVDVRNQALNSFDDLSRYIDTSKFDRAQQTLGSMSDYDTLLNDLLFNRKAGSLDRLEGSIIAGEGNAANQALAARGAYNQAVEGNVAANRADRASRLLQFQDEQARQKQFRQSQQLINMNNLSSEIAGRNSVALGIPAFLEQKRAAQASEAIQNRAIGAAGRGGGGGGSSAPASSGQLPDSGLKRLEFGVQGVE